MKIDWQGEITAVQPRFRLMRSFDQRHHTYLGYALRIRGIVDGGNAEAWLGVGKASHEKYRFEIGQVASGQAHVVADPRIEPVEYYKVSRVAIAPRQNAPYAPSVAGRRAADRDISRTRPSASLARDVFVGCVL
jgi:hypothetical protein